MTAVISKALWYRITPSRLTFLLLITESLLWFSQRFDWFVFNRHKGYTLLIALAVLGLATVVILLWLLVALVVRRRFQLSIRSLLLLALVVALQGTWVAMDIEAARMQREAVEDIQNDGGVIAYDYELPPGVAVFPHPSPPGPPWLRRLLGDHLFVNVARASFTGSTVSDANLGHLTGLAQLQELDLHGTKVTDAALERLKALTQLRGLGLNDTKISDRGLEHLTALAQLRVLNLEDTEVSDAGLEHLSGLTELRMLNLIHTKVSDAGLEHLRGLRQLQDLFLTGTKVSDEGLRHLGGLVDLQLLYLWGTKVTDAGAERLQRALPRCRIRR